MEGQFREVRSEVNRLEQMEEGFLKDKHLYQTTLDILKLIIVMGECNE